MFRYLAEACEIMGFVKDSEVMTMAMVIMMVILRKIMIKMVVMHAIMLISKCVRFGVYIKLRISSALVSVTLTVDSLEVKNSIPLDMGCDMRLTTVCPPQFFPGIHLLSNPNGKGKQLGKLATSCQGPVSNAGPQIRS